MTTGLSWVRVTLDTTPPKLYIYMPNITTNQSIEYLTIESDEELVNKQEIYIVDSLNVKHKFTFSLHEDKKTFTGRISFQAFPMGMAHLYVQLYDEVWNKSELYKKSINILDPQNIKMFVSEYIGKLTFNNFTRKTVVSEMERVLHFNESIMPVSISDKLEEGED